MIGQGPPNTRGPATFRGGRYDGHGFDTSALAKQLAAERTSAPQEYGGTLIVYRSKADAALRIETVKGWRAKLHDATEAEAYEFDADMSLIHGWVRGQSGRLTPAWVWSRCPLPPTTEECADGTGSRNPQT